jgi:phosphoribosylformimino-5-aminoimidazole carboxamide ribotide isomerase
MADIEALCEVEDDGVEGVICGAGLQRRLDFEAAQARATS